MDAESLSVWVGQAGQPSWMHEGGGEDPPEVQGSVCPSWAQQDCICCAGAAAHDMQRPPDDDILHLVRETWIQKDGVPWPVQSPQKFSNSL